MRTRTLAILAVLAALCLGAWLALRSGGASAERVARSALFAIDEIPLERVDRVELVRTGGFRMVFERAGERQDLLGVPDRLQAQVGEARAVVVAMEQRAAELALELADAAGDRRLTDVELMGGGTEAAEARNPNQRLNLVEADPHDPSCRSS